MRRKIIILTATMLLNAVGALAQGGTTGPLTWDLENGTLTISGEETMPNYAYGGAPWFAYREFIHTIIIEDGVTTIGNYAFPACSSLTSITIPNSITTIGEEALGSCTSLTSITLPNSVTTIGRAAFAYCENLPSITIPSSVTTIGINAFYCCTSLTSITIPDSVTSLGNGAFFCCISLTSVTLSNNITTIGSSVFFCCMGLTSITIPNSVTTIGDDVFYRCTSLSSIILTNGIITIGQDAFAHCLSLTSITIPSSVTTIGTPAFSDCLSLLSIDVESESNNFASEDGVLFNKNKTTLIRYPSGKTETLYVIPNSVTNIKDLAFSDCTNLTSFEVESGNNSFNSEDGILFDINKTTLICCPGGKTGGYIIPNSVTSIATGAFFSCPSLTSITLPNSITTIGISAFWGCSSLTSIIIPNGVTAIEYGTFLYCTNLTSITLPSSVTRIKDVAFAHCPNLTSITNLNPEPTATSIYAFDGLLQHLCTLKVPTSAVSAYQNADRWKKFNIVGGGISVNPIANNNKYGYTMGEGLYEENEEVDVMAVARDGYKFVNWTKNGVEISDRALYSFTVTEDVELVAHFESEVGIGELRVTSYELQVYPNPTRGEIQVTSYELQVTCVEVFDVFGRNVGVKLPSFGGVGGGDISHLPAGIYFLRIQTETGVVTRKVVKQ